MACFLVPAGEAVVATIVTHVLEKKEASAPAVHIAGGSADAAQPFSAKLRWLSNLLWGGSFLLAFEHLWHGELTPLFPFLTAAGDPSTLPVMLQEMGTVGVTMAAFVTAVWGVMVLAARRLEKAAPAGQDA